MRHGVLQRISGGAIDIRITNYETYYEVIIQDDGVGMTSEKVKDLLKEFPSNKSGIGLANTNRRLKRLFGKGLEITSVPAEGTIVKFQIPYREK